MKNLSVVIDTNVFLIIIPSRSKFHWVFEAIRNNQLNLLLSSEIVLEYEEQLKFRYKIDVANQLLEILLMNRNITLVKSHYNWNLIAVDPDDNKFVDCAIAGNADIIITNDSDFNILKQIDFPKVNVATIEEFELIFKENIQSRQH